MKCALGTRTFFFVLIVLKVLESIEDESVGQNPLLIGEELLGIPTQIAREATKDCDEPKFSDISLLLYTRNNPTHPIKLKPNNTTGINLKEKTVMLIHGYVSTPTTYRGPKIKNAYLKRYDCNVILLDWTMLAVKLYPTSVCLVPKIARLVASFLCGISSQLGISLRTHHLGGISLGGQMSGLIGQETKNICREEIGRITALDPSGPLFQGLPESRRLDKSDATFVDVIHTNKGGLGYFGNCGDVDFYPNCGTFQNGCPKVDVIEAMKYPPLACACDHVRSLDYMLESMTSNNFKAKSCKYCPEYCSPDKSNEAEAVMGEGCSTNTSSGAYVLQTNSESPFAMG